MKILQIGKFYPIIGGVEKVMFDLTSGFAAIGVECDMLCANYDTTVKKLVIKELTPNNRIIICPAIKKLFATMISPAMIRELKRRCNDYDIIHIHHPDPMAALALYMSNYKGKIVLHWHSDILTHAVEQIRSQYPGKKIIFSLGRLVEYKGYEYLIDAAKNLSDDYIILIGGSGPLKDSLQAQIDDNKLQSKVKLLGRVSEEDLPNYYQAIDLYCLSSTMKTEAFAIVQVEAMASRKPVVSTRIPGSGVAWVNADQESGITVETHSAKALSDAFKKILEDKDIYDRLAQGARNRYETVFRKEKMIQKCLDIYRSLNG